MDCPECGRTNRTGAKFCAGCATPLIPACTACGHRLAPDAKFCDECGHPVGAPAPATVENEAIRKTVTVLFCDLVGSTPFGEQVDTESVRETLGRYHSMVQRAVEDRGGTVAKFIGDGVMAVFGVPEVAEDDAERTVATGLELQRGFAAIHSVVKARFGVDLGLRVGINTGEVVISDDDSDLVGDVLNTAARLEAACQPGGVLVGEDTWRLTRSTIRYESLGEIQLKGKSEGVAAFHAVDEAAVDDDAATPFVGRTAEVRALLDVIDSAVAAGEVRLATVIGAPGVGKTRLADELEKVYAGEATFVDIRIERTGGTTFAPVAELLRVAAGLDDAHGRDEVLEKIRALVDGLDDADRVATLLASFVGATEPRSTEELFFAVRRLLEAIGQTRSIVIVVDDIQWAEPLLLDLLEHLAEWVSDAPAVVLALARPELREIRPALAEKGRRVTEVIALEGLDAEATAELAARLVGAAALPADLLDRLPESTEGNPLFVRELMKMLVDDKVIVEGENGWELAIDAEAVEVPPTIQSLLSSRIERLPGPERRLLERGSVVGADFPLGAIAALTPQGDAGRLIPILERLRRKELVEPTGAYWGNEPIFRFHHALIRDAAYRRLLKRTRADHHLTVAEWMENSATTVTGEHEVAVGYHLEQAHDLRVQLNIHDEETAEIGARAAETLGAAARRALRRDDVAVASSLATRAVALLEDDAEDLPGLLMLGCEAHFALGDVGGGLPLLKQLEDHAGDDARLAAWARAFRAQLRVLTEPDRLVEAEAAAATAADSLAELDDRTGEANARLVRAGALARLGHIGECETELDKALTAARAADDGRRVATVLGAAPVAALWGPSPVPRAGGRCLDVLRLLRITTGSPRVEATSTRCQAVLEALRGRFDTARSMLSDSRASVEQLGDRHGLLETQLYWGFVELLAGEPEAAEPHLRAAYGGLGRLGIGADAGQAAAHLSRALLLQGRLEEAADLAADSEALAGQNPQTAIAAKAAQAELLAAQGRLDDALRVAGEAVAHAEGTDILIDDANANLTLARVRALAGDGDGAREALDEAERLFTAKGASIDVTVDFPSLDRTEPDTGSEAAAPTAAPSAVEDSEDRNLREVVDGEWKDARRDLNPWNEADRLNREMTRLAGARDHDRLRSMLDDDVVLEDRRTARPTTTVGPSAVVEFFGTEFPTASELTVQTETIACRGNDFVLQRCVFRQADDSSGAASAWLMVGEWRDGRAVRAVLFEPDDLRAAVAELDRLYLETVDDLVERDHLLKTSMVYAGVTERSRGADGSPSMVAFLDSDYVQHDHRPLGWGVRDRAGHAERVESLITDPGEVTAFVARVFESGTLASRIEACICVTGADRAAVVDVQHMVNEIDPGSGLLLRTDRFGEDQTDEAHRFWGELEARTRDVVANVASLRGALTDTWARRDERALWESVVADDLVVEDGHGTSLADPGCLDLDRAADLGFGVGSRRVVAVRGQRLALVLHDDGEQSLRVEEVDADCRLARVVVGEATRLPDAVHELERRWVEVEPSVDADVFSSVHASLYPRTGHGDWADRFAADFRLVDHRVMGYGSGDLDWFRDVAASRDPGALVVAPVFWEWNEHGALYPLARWHVGGEGRLEPAAPAPAIGITVVREGRIAAFEIFADDAEDDARRRFAELTADPVDGRDEPWNAADRLNREVMWCFEHDHAGWRRRWSPDGEYHDRRSMVADVHRGLDDIEESFPLGFLVPRRIETLATRGDDLVLTHTTMRVTDAIPPGWVEVPFEYLGVTRVGPDGRLDRLYFFDPGDLDGALELLDQLFVEGSATPFEAFCLRFWNDAYAQNRRPMDVERGLAFHHPEFRMTDHREASWPEQDLAGLRTRFESIEELEGEPRMYLARIRGTAGRSWLFEAQVGTELPDGTVHAVPSLLLTTFDPATGLDIATEQFAPDAAAEATERLQAVGADDVLVNTASLLANRAHAWHRAGKWQLMATSLSPDVEVKGGDGECIARSEELLDPDVAGSGRFGGGHRRVLAVRDERLALMEWAREPDSEAAERCFAVVELDGLARLSDVHLFDWEIESLTAAVDHLEARWQATSDLDDVDVLTIEAIAAWRHGDLAALERILHEEFAIVDQRTFGWGDFDKRTFISLFEVEARNVVVETPAIYLGGTGSGRAFQLTAWGFSEDGLIDALRGHFVLVLRDGQALRCDGHDIDTPERTLRRLRELQTELGDIVDESSETPGDEWWNEADRRSRDLLRLVAVGEVEQYRLLLAEDVVVDDRRAGIATRIEGRDDAVTVTMPGIYADDVEVVLDIEPVASRGEDLVLHRCTIRQADGHGAQLEWLNVASWRAGRLDLAVQFDPHDVGAAVAELDRLYQARSGDPAVSRRVRAWTSSLGAVTAGDAAGGSAYGDETFEWTDHRPIGWGVLDHDQVENRFASLEQLPGEHLAYVARFRAAAGPVEWVDSHVRLLGPDGSQHVDAQVLVNALDPSSGLMHCTHQYGADQLSEAREKFAELTASARSRGDLWNSAVGVGGSVNSWVRRGDTARLDSWTRPDLALTDVDGNRHRLGRTGLVGVGEHRELGLGVEQRRVLAVRGERLALSELRDDDGRSTHHLAVEEIDADAQLASITLFAPTALADAVWHLEQRWLEDEPPAHGELIQLHARLVHSFSVADRDELDSILADDVTFTDHRDLGLGTGDREWILDAAEQNHAAGASPVDARYLEWHGHAVLGWMLPWQLDEDGHLVQAGVSAYSLMHSVGGRVAGVEFFPDDHLDAARARLRELTQIS